MNNQPIDIDRNTKKHKKRTSWVTRYFKQSINFVALLIVICMPIYFFVESNGQLSQSDTPKEDTKFHEKANFLENEHEEQVYVKNENDENDNVIYVNESTSSNALHGLAQTELTNMDYTGTLDDIKEDLIKHEDIIPYSGVLGSDMHFIPEEIIVLTHEWVFAPFDDGHTGGYLLLSYEINDGKINQWKVISSYLYGQNHN